MRADDIDRLGRRRDRRAAYAVVPATHPIYLSIDIDVLDPAFAPGTGTPEMGGLTSRELLALVRALPRDQIVAADLVEVSPAYDHAEITSLAAATLGLRDLLADGAGRESHVIDLLVRDVRVRDEETGDARGGRPLTSTAAGSSASRPVADEPVEAREVVAGGGAWATPPYVEPHVHLDAALTAGQPRWNTSGTLWEGIACWAERKPMLTREDVIDRAEQTLRWYAANGTLHVRSHVDVTDPSLVALDALLEVRDRVRDVIDAAAGGLPAGGHLLVPGRRGAAGRGRPGAAST